MRIITGKLKGRRFSTPGNTDIRPTSDRTKESMFSVIEVRKHIAGSVVLDLFAGSGNLGFEAISRGADRVVFVESLAKAVDNIEKQAAAFGVQKQVHGICANVETFLRNTGQAYDLVFADPPYDYEFMADLPEIILQNGWLKDDGWFILEHDKRHHFGEHPHCVFAKPYGRTIVTIFTKEPVS